MVFKKLYELSIGELKTEFRRAGLDGDFSVGYAVVRLTVHLVKNGQDPYNFQFDTEDSAKNVIQEVHDDGKAIVAESVASTVPLDGSVEAGKKEFEIDRVKDDTSDVDEFSPVVSIKEELTSDGVKDDSYGDMEIFPVAVDKKELASCVVKNDSYDVVNITGPIWNVLSSKSSAISLTILELTIANASSTFVSLPISTVSAESSSFEWMYESRLKLWPPDSLFRYHTMRNGVMSLHWFP